jgi:hypothetical protein
MSTCEVRLFVLKGCFTAYVSGLTVVDEIFCPPMSSLAIARIYGKTLPKALSN